jgi:hypothetical protein
MVHMTRRVTTRALPALILGGAFLFLALVAVLVVAKGDLIEDDGQPTTILVSGQSEVPRGQVHDDVLALRGTVVVRGTVEDDVLLVDGRVRVEGIVHGDVIVLNGDAVLGRNAEVDGDLLTSAPSRAARTAVVRGEVGSAGPFDALAAVPRTVWFGLWLAAGLCLLALALLAPGAIRKGAVAAERRPVRSFALGSALLLVGPLAVAVLALSLIGSVIAVVLTAGLVVAGALGAAVTAGYLGRLVLPHDGQASPFVGIAGVGAALALALLVSVPLAVVAALAVVAFGLGALVPRAEVATATEVEEDVEPAASQLSWDLDPDRDPLPVREANGTKEHDDEGPRILARFPIASGAGEAN